MLYSDVECLCSYLSVCLPNSMPLVSFEQNGEGLDIGLGQRS